MQDGAGIGACITGRAGAPLYPRIWYPACGHLATGAGTRYAQAGAPEATLPPACPLPARLPEPAHPCRAPRPPADPIHDFGFLRFDPSRLQFMEVSEVPLAPEGATVGLDIRVVGNDSGEKVRARGGVGALAGCHVRLRCGLCTRD